MKRTIIEISVLIVLVAVIVLLLGYSGHSRRDAERYRENTDALLSEVERYKIRDSLNVVSVAGLRLQLSEYERLRAEDAALVADLKTKKRNLENIVTLQSRTIQELSCVGRDTVIIRDSVPVSAIELKIRDKWYDFDGTLAGREFSGRFVSRDSLVVVESIERTRCIVKKWRKIKSVKVDVISKNPNTKIEGIQYVVIEK